MAKPTIVTRAGKGSALTWTEGDANVTNLCDATITVKAGTGGTDVISDLNGTVTLVAGTNISLSGNNTAKTVTINNTASTGIANVVEDTTPQLGGDLDLNTFKIVTASGNLNIEPASGSNANITTLGVGNVNLSAASGNVNLSSVSGKIYIDGLEWPTADGSIAQILRTNGTGVLSWVTNNLDGLSDVVITSAATNDALIFNGTTWVDTALSGVTVGTATVGSTVTLTADNTTNATNYPTFVNAATGNLSPRTDTGFTYNPSTGLLTATGFSGSGASLTSIPNAALTNSAITFGATSTSLGGTVSALNAVTIGASSASSGAFTTLSSSTSASLKAINEGALFDLGTTGGTLAPNVANGNVQKVTLNAALTINAFTTPVAGQTLTLIIYGGTAYTSITSTMKFAGGIKTLTATAGCIDILSVYYDGTTYFASLGKGFA